MVRRRRNQTYSRSGISCFCNPRIYFLPRKMSSFPWFCSLCHFDLNLISTDQITACHSKTSACHLLDRRTTILLCPFCQKPFRRLSTFSTVGSSMNLVHRQCKRLMCFLRDGSVGHGSCLKTFHNLVYTFYFLNRNSFFRVVEFHQTSKISGLFLINFSRIIFKNLIIILPYRLLEKMDRPWIIPMVFSLTAKLMSANTLQCQIGFQS